MAKNGNGNEPANLDPAYRAVLDDVANASLPIRRAGRTLTSARSAEEIDGIPIRRAEDLTTTPATVADVAKGFVVVERIRLKDS